VHSPAQHIGQRFFNERPHGLRMVSRTEMSRDHEFVLKTVTSLYDVIQVHVAEFVNLVTTMIGRDESQLANQHLRFVHHGVIVQPAWRAIADVRQYWPTNFGANIRSREPQVSNLIAA
jgi:hypothetical protein